MLLLNLLLAIAWVALTGEMTLANFSVGALFGFGILWIVNRVAAKSQYHVKVLNILTLTVYFFWELFLATLRVCVDIVTPRHRVTPAILAVPIQSNTDAETTLLANMITLTPGTLTVDVSEDGKMLFVHVMYVSQIEPVREAIQAGFGRRVHEVFAP